MTLDSPTLCYSFFFFVQMIYRREIVNMSSYYHIIFSQRGDCSLNNLLQLTFFTVKKENHS